MACTSANRRVLSQRGVMTRNIQAGMERKHCEVGRGQPCCIGVGGDGVKTYDAKCPAIVAYDAGTVCAEDSNLHAPQDECDDDLGAMEAKFDLGNQVGIPLEFEHGMLYVSVVASDATGSVMRLICSRHRLRRARESLVFCLTCGEVFVDSERVKSVRFVKGAMDRRWVWERGREKRWFGQKGSNKLEQGKSGSADFRRYVAGGRRMTFRKLGGPCLGG
jgi:hypothetical protein